MKPSEVIREARSLLFERGWGKGEFEAPDGSLCVLGAMRRVCNIRAGEMLPFSVHNPVGQACETAWVPDWNDDPDRTFDEVVDMLDRAEKIAEQQEAAS